ncbi:MAG: cupin domain-containing protein [Alphaproteobacteria bacterium]|jgi:quercetin dioxygenase-like cupin family protein|nr:cupin domain-containing protein [Alphaproteobacteria bacterium]
MAVQRFNLNDPEGGLVRALAAGMETRLFWGKHAMLSVLTCAPNAAGESHHHEEEQWAVVIEGAGVLVVGPEELDVGPGDVCHIPAGTPHNFIAGPAGARLLDIFSPPRAAYTRSDGGGFAAR